jgi:Protein of unknown function (Hypoth_ymh)
MPEMRWAGGAVDALRILPEPVQLERNAAHSNMSFDKNSNKIRPSDQPAGLQYVGIAGVSKDCQDAVLRFIQFGTRITHVCILSAKSKHCLLLTLEGGDRVAVKSGFATGYSGEGPRRFSYVLQILDSHGAEIVEHDVEPSLLDKIDDSAVTKPDLGRVDSMPPVLPTRWHDYVFPHDFERAREGTLWRQEFPAVMPFALIDARIMDLALDFWNSPDNSLLVGYRRLEDIVRKRTAIEQHGTKLFSRAFNLDGGALTWEDLDDGERVGRMQLFTGTYAAHRNRRAHKELRTHGEELMAEFLLLNHLYCLERDAVECGKGLGPGVRSLP